MAAQTKEDCVLTLTGKAQEQLRRSIDFVETIWTKGFTIRNTAHNCNHHTMQ